jgi:hypothetical protein
MVEFAGGGAIADWSAIYLRTSVLTEPGLVPSPDPASINSSVRTTKAFGQG